MRDDFTQFCTVSGRMMSLSRASSLGMANPGMEVWKMREMDDRLVYIFMKKNLYTVHASLHMTDDFYLILYT